jgi:integrase/recombinase XerD
MRDPSRARITGPLEPFAAGFAAELARQGYTPNSAGLQMGLIAHLDRWLAAEGRDVATLGSAAIEGFLAARRDAGYTAYLSGKALEPLLAYLRGLGVAPASPALAPGGPVEELLERYRRYLTIERGLGAPTARGYVDKVRPFLDGLAAPNGIDVALECLSPTEVIAFVAARCPRQGRSAAKLTVSSLRSLLVYLHVQGAISRPLAAAVPSVASRRLAGLPKRLERDELRRLLASCDRHSANGRRDFAILTMLARLGLRAGEIAALCFDDIDWRAGEIVVCGKGRRSERLPLPADVGEALADYLRDGRPKSSEGRAVFVRVKAPHRGLTSGGVTQVVAAAARRSGLGKIHAHRLRHTAASELLRAGASLPEIGQVLRHRRALTTAIYAKVDREALRTIARRWPGAIA